MTAPSQASPASSGPTEQDLKSLLTEIDTFMRKRTVAFESAAAGRLDLDHFIVSGPSDYSTDRLRQTMKHIAAALLSYVKELKGVKDHEVQLMEIGAVVVVSSNSKESTKALHELFERALQGAFSQMLDRIIQKLTEKITTARAHKTPENFLAAIQRKGDFDTLRFCFKLLKALATTDDLSGQPILKLFKNIGADPDQVTLIQRALQPAQAAGMIQKNGTKQPLIVLLDPADDIHAEQNFLYVLCTLKPPQPVTIYGSKRPCYMCFACLSFFATHFKQVPLTFSQKPGQYWSTAASSFSRVAGHLAGELSMSTEQVTAWFKAFVEQHPEMHVMNRQWPASVPRKPGDEDWGQTKIERVESTTDGGTTVKVKHSGKPGNNYQSDSESEADTETVRRYLNRHPYVKRPKKPAQKRPRAESTSDDSGDSTPPSPRRRYKRLPGGSRPARTAKKTPPSTSRPSPQPGPARKRTKIDRSDQMDES